MRFTDRNCCGNFVEGSHEASRWWGDVWRLFNPLEGGPLGSGLDRLHECARHD